MSVIAKFMLSATAIETVIVAAGIYIWFCLDLSEYVRNVLIFVSVPMLFAWFLSCFTTIYVMRKV